jgi:REP element-mobilizing transposase RayT
LTPDKYKDILIDSLKYLVKIGKIKVYGFVIMPNHIHLIWELLDLNGKESPHSSGPNP